ncbi:MAG: hypothetical protein QXS37_00760 [Candidatus Aenigmatarchaeota archaeon]
MNELTVDKAFMVTRRTLQTHMKFGFLATGVMRESESGFLGEKWYKTIWDLLSDILSLRSGTKTLFWLYEEEYGELFFGTCGVRNFSSDATVFFHPKTLENVSGINYPFRALIAPETLWKVVVPADLIFSDPRFSQYLWTIASKKSLRRGKSLVTLPPNGSRILSEAAATVEDYVKKSRFWTREEVEMHLPSKNEKYPADGSLVQLSVEWFSRVLEENDVEEKPELIRIIPRSPGEVDIFKLPSRRGDEVLVEKVLEAWLSLNIDKDPNLLEILDVRDLVWFSNYVPCTVSGANADFLIFGRSDRGTKLYIFELKKKILRGNDLLEAIQELRRYSYIFFTLMKLNLSGIPSTEVLEVQPVLIGKDIRGRIPKGLLNKFESTLGTAPLLLNYEISEGKIEFEEIANGLESSC